MSNRIKFTFVIAFALIVVYGSYVTIANKQPADSLHRNHSIIIGKVDECRAIGKYSDARIEYRYDVNGKQYVGDKKYSRIDKYRCDDFTGKSFLVAYDPANIQNSQILINRKDYEDFKLLFPDSLKWVDRYFR